MAPKLKGRSGLRDTIVFVGLLVMSIVFMILSDSMLLNATESVGFTVFSSVQEGFTGVGRWFSDTVHSIKELKELKAVYSEAENRLEYYQGLEREVITLREENVRLRDQLDYSKRTELLNIPAKIIARDPNNIFESIIINKGSRDGVVSGAPVIAYQNGNFGLVGRVIQIGPISSIIKPIFESTSFIAARLDISRYEGLVQGQNDQSLEMMYVSRNARNELSAGDLVVTSGMSTVFPEGISIGRISSIMGAEYEPSVSLILAPVIDFSRLEYVLILEPDAGEEL